MPSWKNHFRSFGAVSALYPDSGTGTFTDVTDRIVFFSQYVGSGSTLLKNNFFLFITGRQAFDVRISTGT
jgi:hypothetical protein